MIKGLLEVPAAATLQIDDNVRIIIQNDEAAWSPEECHRYANLDDASHVQYNLSALPVQIQHWQGWVRAGMNVTIMSLHYGFAFGPHPFSALGDLKIIAPVIVIVGRLDVAGYLDLEATSSIYKYGLIVVTAGHYGPSEIPPGLGENLDCRNNRLGAGSYITSYPGAFADYIAGIDICMAPWTEIDGGPSDYYLGWSDSVGYPAKMYPPKLRMKAPYIFHTDCTDMKGWDSSQSDEPSLPGGTIIVEAEDLELAAPSCFLVPGGRGGFDNYEQYVSNGVRVNPKYIKSSGGGGVIYLKGLRPGTEAAFFLNYEINGGALVGPVGRRLTPEELTFDNTPWDPKPLPYHPLWQGGIDKVSYFKDQYQGGPGLLYYSIVDGGIERHYLKYHCGKHFEVTPTHAERVISRVPYKFADDFIDKLTIAGPSNILFDPTTPTGRALEYKVGSVEVIDPPSFSVPVRPTLIVEYPATLDLRCQRVPSGLDCPETLRISYYSIVLKGGVVRTPPHVIFDGAHPFYPEEGGAEYALFSAQVRQGASIAFPDVVVAEFWNTEVQWSSNWFDPKVLQEIRFENSKVVIVESQEIAARTINVMGSKFEIDVSLHLNGDDIEIDAHSNFVSTYSSTRVQEHPLSNLLSPKPIHYGGVHAGCNSFGGCDDILADIVGASNFRNPTLPGSSGGSYSGAASAPGERTRTPIGGAHLRIDARERVSLLGEYHLQGKDASGSGIAPYPSASAGGSFVLRAKHIDTFAPAAIDISGGSATPPLSNTYSGASAGRASIVCESVNDLLDLSHIKGYGGSGSNGYGGTGVAAGGTLYVDCEHHEETLVALPQLHDPSLTTVPLDIVFVPGEYPKSLALRYGAFVRVHLFDYNDVFQWDPSLGAWQTPTGLLQHTLGYVLNVIRVKSDDVCPPFDLATFFLTTPSDATPAWREKMIYNYVQKCINYTPSPSATPFPSTTPSATHTHAAVSISMSRTSTQSVTGTPTPTTTVSSSQMTTSTGTTTRTITSTPATPTPEATHSSGPELEETTSPNANTSPIDAGTFSNTVTPTLMPVPSEDQDHHSDDNEDGFDESPTPSPSSATPVPPPALPSDGNFAYIVLVRRRDGSPCTSSDFPLLQSEAEPLFREATSNDIGVSVRSAAYLTPQDIIAIHLFAQVQAAAPFSLAVHLSETLNALDPFDAFASLSVHEVISGRRHYKSEAGVGSVYEAGVDDGQMLSGQARTDKLQPVYFSMSSLGGLILGLAAMFLLLRLRRRHVTKYDTSGKDALEFHNPIHPTAAAPADVAPSTTARRAAELQTANNVSRLAFGTRNARVGNGSNKALSKKNNNPAAYNTQLHVVPWSASEVDPSIP